MMTIFMNRPILNHCHILALRTRIFLSVFIFLDLSIAHDTVDNYAFYETFSSLGSFITTLFILESPLCLILPYFISHDSFSCPLYVSNFQSCPFPYYSIHSMGHSPWVYSSTCKLQLLYFLYANESYFYISYTLGYSFNHLLNISSDYYKARSHSRSKLD